MTGGRLVAIYIAPSAGAPMHARDRIEAIAGVGLRDDRYATGLGTYSGTGRGPRDVTLIEREAIDAVRTEDDRVAVREDQTRRNLVTEGVALNHLVGREFRVGPVRMRGVRLSEPCAYLEQLTGLVGVRAALVHRGGLRAEVLGDGELRVGDDIRHNWTAPDRVSPTPRPGSRGGDGDGPCLPCATKEAAWRSSNS